MPVVRLVLYTAIKLLLQIRTHLPKLQTRLVLPLFLVHFLQVAMKITFWTCLSLNSEYLFRG